MAVQQMGQYCASDRAVGLQTFMPRHHPFVPVEWEFCVAEFPFPIQAVHTLCKAKDVSPPGEYCTFYGLISGDWVHLLGALGYFFSLSVIPVYFSIPYTAPAVCSNLFVLVASLFSIPYTLCLSEQE